MRKSIKFMTTFLATVIMLFSGITPAMSAYAATEEMNEVQLSEENRNLKMTKDKNYLLSYPVSGKGWEVSEIKYSIKKDVWQSYEENVENPYITIEKLEKSKPGNIQLVVRVKSTQVLGLEVNLQNEITGEKKAYGFAATVVLPQEKPSNTVVFLEVESSSEGGNNKSLDNETEDEINISEDKKDTTEDENPSDDETTGDSSDEDNNDNEDDNNNEDNDENDNEGDNEDKDEDEEPSAPIIIDTTGWSFDAINVVYDGTEYTVEVIGLPDYVKPVYSNNTRTNAGTSTAHVSFIVPEGYVTPKDMETTITIQKAPIYTITDKNLVSENGGLKFSIPEGALPEGISYQYTISGITEEDFTITNIGNYIVNTNFIFSEDFSEEMRQNYITDSSAIYNVVEHEDVIESQYGLDFILLLNQEESEDPNEVRISVSIHFPDPMGRNSTLTYVPVYDKSILTYKESIVPDGLSGGKINSQGIASASTPGLGLLNEGLLTTFIFTINENADITNLPFTLTDISGFWIGPDFTMDASTSAPTAIVLNPSVDTNQYTVMLPCPAGTNSYSLMPLSETAQISDVMVESSQVNANSTQSANLVSNNMAKTDTSVSEAEEASSKIDSNVSEAEVASSNIDASISKTEDASSKINDSTSETENIFSEIEDNAFEAEDTSSKIGDNASEAEDASPEIGNNASEAEDTSSKIGDNASEAEDISSEVGDNASEIEDTSSKIEDNASETEDASSKIEVSIPDAENISSEVDTTIPVAKDTLPKEDTSTSEIEDTSSEREENAS